MHDELPEPQIKEPEAGATWAERAGLERLEAVLDPCDTRGGKNRLIDRVHKRALEKAVGASLRGRTVLDFGCGTGRMSHWLLHRGADVDGVDSSPEMIAAAARLVPQGRFQVTDGSSLPFPDARFDLVVSVFVLQYYVDEYGVIPYELTRVLRVGGRLVAIEQVTESDLGRGGPVDAYVEMLETAGLSAIESTLVRVSESRVVATAQRFPTLSRLPGAPWLVTAEAGRRSGTPLTGGRYADALLRAVKPN